ncbi:RNA polymerase sigma factor [Azospirillum soli]|uniref:RNA polymerase sigma factor n=1 Tax=Azospirillum soli TaxID=1304799 RepID=UPI001AEB8DDC|nr:RNA polymerase sigma factor [Azospirillum soli]MBP2316444.1 RNA polymerase sigma-70 factor (ECF subfamily) [Azospirillum soli]
MDQTKAIMRQTVHSDFELAGRIRCGDADAFRILMQRHNQRLFRMARSVLRDPAEAEDAVQDAYVLVFTHIGQFREDASLATWLGRIVLNEALRRLRQRKAMTELPMTELDEDGADGRTAGAEVIPFPGAQPPPATPEEEAARAETRRLLERAIDALPDPFRVVFVLREIEQMSVEETASSLGIPPDTVKTRLHRARRLLGRSLRQQLAPDLAGVFPFAGERCARIVARVLDRLGLPAPPPGGG